MTTITVDMFRLDSFADTSETMVEFTLAIADDVEVLKLNTRFGYIGTVSTYSYTHQFTSEDGVDVDGLRFDTFVVDDFPPTSAVQAVLTAYAVDEDTGRIYVLPLGTNLTYPYAPLTWNSFRPENMDGSRGLHNSLLEHVPLAEFEFGNIRYSENDVVVLDPHSNVAAIGSGRDRVDGGGGTDTIRMGADWQLVSANLATGAVVKRAAEGSGHTITDSFTNFENIYARGHAMTLHGTDMENTLSAYIRAEGPDRGAQVYGLGGNDTLIARGPGVELYGGDGNDTLRALFTADDIMDGGAGDDTIEALGGDDRIYGGDGNDEIDAGHGADLVEGGDGDDVIHGGGRNDDLRGQNDNDTIYGGDHNDKIKGGRGDDALHGEDGDDKVLGNHGKDVVTGGDDDDILDGGSSADRLNGGKGHDVLTGGNGKDVFVFTSEGGMGQDRITDWEDGKDRLDLTSYGYADFADLLASATVEETETGLRLDLTPQAHTSTRSIDISGLALADFNVSDVILV